MCVVNSLVGIEVTSVYPDAVLGMTAPVLLHSSKKGNMGGEATEHILYLCVSGFMSCMAKLVN